MHRRGDRECQPPTAAGPRGPLRAGQRAGRSQREMSRRGRRVPDRVSSTKPATRVALVVGRRRAPVRKQTAAGPGSERPPAGVRPGAAARHDREVRASDPPGSPTRSPRGRPTRYVATSRAAPDGRKAQSGPWKLPAVALEKSPSRASGRWYRTAPFCRCFRGPRTGQACSPRRSNRNAARSGFGAVRRKRAAGNGRSGQ